MHQKSEAGFTLIELMVVVVIIMAIAAMAGPAMGTLLADRRASETTYNLARVARHARSQAISSGRAHLMTFGNRDVRLVRGNNNLCNNTNWQNLLGAGACTAAGSPCYDQIIFEIDGAERSKLEADNITVAVGGGGGALHLCYEPSGRLWYINGGVLQQGAFLNASTAAIGGAFTVNVQRGLNGVVRQVIFPLGADARVRR